MNFLKKMLAPESIAVIGASRRDGTLGKMFLDAVVEMQFSGKIFPVNPKADEINGITCYPDIVSLPETPDLAVILISRDHVLPAIDLLAQIKVKNIIVISAGFRETGEQGKILEDQLIGAIKRNGMRMIGPNSMGLFNTHPGIKLNATFSPTQPIPGHVAFISQSGALGVAVLELSIKLGLGFSVFVSTGNKADIGDTDVLRYAAADDNTRTIIVYQEAIDQINDFRRIVNDTIRKKPVLILKAGRTESGIRAATSHTGALAVNDRLSDAFLNQCGVIRCNSLQELLYSAQGFSTQPLPEGSNVAVVTNAGGPGILASDALESNGLNLPELSEKVCNQLKAILPAEAGIKNPIDMIASATHDTYREVCTIINQADNIHALFIIIVKPPVDTTPVKIIKEISKIIEHSRKPFFFIVMADTDNDPEWQNAELQGKLIFPYPESAATVLGNMVRYNHIKNNLQPIKKISRIKPAYSAQKRRQLSFTQMAELFEKYNIPVVPFLLTDDFEQARLFMEKEKSVAVKTGNEEVIHKSDLGLVRFNISSIPDLKNTLNDITKKVSRQVPDNSRIQFLLQKMVPAGIEMILGSSLDPTFGQVIMFGAGGVFVELYQDVVFKISPLTRYDARTMISEIKSQKILNGFRGLPKVDKKVLVELIYSFAQLVEENPQIVEMDINPMIWPAGYQHPLVVDCRMTVVDQD